MLKSATLEVIGEQKLHCEACENRVMRLLKGLDGVVRVRAHASNQRVDVQFESEVVDPSRITERLEQAGYETRLTSSAQTPSP